MQGSAALHTSGTLTLPQKTPSCIHTHPSHSQTQALARQQPKAAQARAQAGHTRQADPTMQAQPHHPAAFPGLKGAACGRCGWGIATQAQRVRRKLPGAHSQVVWSKLQQQALGACRSQLGVQLMAPVSYCNQRISKVVKWQVNRSLGVLETFHFSFHT